MRTVFVKTQISNLKFEIATASPQYHSITAHRKRQIAHLEPHTTRPKPHDTRHKNHATRRKSHDSKHKRHGPRLTTQDSRHKPQDPRLNPPASSLKPQAPHCTPPTKSPPSGSWNLASQSAPSLPSARATVVWAARSSRSRVDRRVCRSIHEGLEQRVCQETRRIKEARRRYGVRQLRKIELALHHFYGAHLLNEKKPYRGHGGAFFVLSNCSQRIQMLNPTAPNPHPTRATWRQPFPSPR